MGLMMIGPSKPMSERKSTDERSLHDSAGPPSWEMLTMAILMRIRSGANLIDALDQNQKRQRFDRASRKPTCLWVLRTSFSVLAAALALPAGAQSTGPDASAVASSASTANLVRWTGSLPEMAGRTVEVSFALYQDPAGGPALWNETQTVTVGAGGRYTVLLGATSAEGLPQTLFQASEARWIEANPIGKRQIDASGRDVVVEVANAMPPARSLLAAVPYAFESMDAETLAGRAASDYVTREDLTSTVANQVRAVSNMGTQSGIVGVPPPIAGMSSSSRTTVTGAGTAGYLPVWAGSATLDNSMIFESGTNVGIGTSTPATMLDVNGASTFRAGASLLATAATLAAGVNSPALQLGASTYSSTGNAAVPQNFVWQAASSGNNTANPTANLQLLFGSGTRTPVATGLSIAPNGQITFAQGQTFPGVSSSPSTTEAASTLTGVIAGQGLIGGGSTGNVTLALSGPIALANGGTGATTTAAALANLGSTGPVVNVVAYGAIGDWNGSTGTDNTTAFNNAAAAATSLNECLYIPPGKYLTDTITRFTGGLICMTGAGEDVSTIVPRNGDTAFAPSGNANISKTHLADFTISSNGTTAGDGNGYGIYLAPRSQIAGNVVIERVRVGNQLTNQGVVGKAIYIPSVFYLAIRDTMAGSQTDNDFDVGGGNTCLLEHNYAMAVPTDASGFVHAGYRIHAGVCTMVGDNGINETGPGQNWAIFGNNTAEDGSLGYAHVTLIGCNVEGFTGVGIRVKNNSSIDLINTLFSNDSAGVTTGTVEALEFDYSYANNQLDAVSVIARTSSNPAWTGGFAIHLLGGSPPFINPNPPATARGFDSYYNDGASLAYKMPAMYIGSAGSDNYGMQIPNLMLPSVAPGTSVLGTDSSGQVIANMATLANNISGNALTATSARSAATATIAASATTAINVSGGGTDYALYQSASGETSFIAAPTTSGHTFVYGWQPNGSAAAPGSIDLGAYLAAPPAIGETTPGPILASTIAVGSGSAFHVDENGEVHQNGSTPTASAGTITGTNAGGFVSGLKAMTSLTITFANSGWTTWAACVANSSVEGAQPHVVSSSREAVTFAFPLLTGTLYYNCNGK